MNKHVGFVGGDLISEVGTEYDMSLFFKCVNLFVIQEYPNENWGIITDRLYKKYLKHNELNEAEELMNKIKIKFKQILITCVDIDYEKSNLVSMPGNSLYHLFNDLFERFFRCTESARASFELSTLEDYPYQPVFTMKTEIPFVIIEQMKPLTEYDENNGRPFWCSDN